MNRVPAIRWTRALVRVLACASVAACGAVDSARIAGLDGAQARALLVPGHTTEADVRASLGQGSVVHFRSGWETWHYEHREGLAKGWDDVPFIGLVTSRSARPTRELVLLFDDAGTLRRYALQEETPSTRHALAAPAASVTVMPASGAAP